MKSTLLIAMWWMLCAAVMPARGDTFVRVACAADIDTSATYVIASSFNAPRFLLESRSADDGKKIAASKTELCGDTIIIDKNALLWHISQESGAYVISSVETGLYISPGKGAPDITLGDKPIEWFITDRNGGLECATVEDNGKRKLCCDTAFVYFGRFVDNYYGHLVFYKSTGGIHGVTTENIPDTSKEYCLTAYDGDCYFAIAPIPGGTTFPTTFDITKGRLIDGSFALPDESLRIKVESAGKGKFRLSSKDGLYIAPSVYSDGIAGVNAVKQENAALFINEGNGIITTSVDDDDLILTMLPGKTGDELCLCFIEAGKAIPAGGYPVKLSVASEKASATIDERGLKTLKGGFDTDMLAAAQDSTTTSLDLRMAVLPAEMHTFNFCGNTNCIIYVNQDDLPFIPNGWKNVVSCGGASGNHLVRIMQVADGCAFCAAYPFSAGTDSLFYVREISREGWNTVCLPFNVQPLPDDFLLCSAAGVENETVGLLQEEKAKALHPYLFKYTGSNEGNNDKNVNEKAGSMENIAITFRAEAGTVPATVAEEAASGNLQGIFTRRNATSHDNDIYLLANDGMRFVHAAEGSYLNPFRCFLKYDAGKTGKLPIRLSGLTGIDSPKTTKTQKVYDLNGTYWGEAHCGNVNNMPLPAGIYIINGKKIIKH